MKKLLIVLLALCFQSLQLSAQAHFNTSYYKMESRGDKHFAELAFDKALKSYKRALDEEDDNTEIQLKIAECYWQMNQLRPAAEWYAKVAQTELMTPEYQLKYAESLTGSGEYEKARQWFLKYKQNVGYDKRVENKLAGLKELERLQANLKKVRLTKSPFNSKEADFSPFYFKDQLAFVSARRPGLIVRQRFEWDNSFFLNLYVVNEKGEVEGFHKEVNTPYHEGPSVIYKDGKKMIFTRNNYNGKLKQDKDGTSKLKLFYSELEGKDWSEAVEMPFNSEEFSTGHPAITEDGSRLIFVSDRPGGFGGTDLYESHWKDSSWTEPQNMGPLVNTEGNEMFPFIHPNKVLIFGSNGREGLGGLDLYAMRLDMIESGAAHLGTPINSPLDDFGMIVSENGKTGYLSSNREGKDNIYQFVSDVSILPRNVLEGVVKNEENLEVVPNTSVTLYNKQGEPIDSTQTNEKGEFEFQAEPLQPYTLLAAHQAFQPSRKNYKTGGLNDQWRTELMLGAQPEFYFSGDILEKKNKTPIDSVKLTFTDLKSGEKKEYYTNDKGRFSFQLEERELMDTVAYHLKISKRGFLSHQFDFEKVLKVPGYIYLQDLLEKEEIEFELVKIELGMDLYKLLDLKPIYFDLNKSNIRPDAAKELDKVVEALQDNPTMFIELGSHTDSRGSDSYNLLLSQRRAKSSAEYIISRGIKAERIRYKGYGEKELVNDCGNGVPCSDEDHQLNRRTEIIVEKI